MSKKTRTLGSDKLARTIKNMVEGSINIGKRLPMKQTAKSRSVIR